MQPWGFNPMAVYLFLSLHCFEANCELWLVPALQRLRYPKITGLDPVKVYQMIMQLPIFCGDEQAWQEFAAQSTDMRLSTVPSTIERFLVSHTQTSPCNPISG
ncbi:hypothetical protein R3P38DRAFT_3092814 [Favolaschia claudopus]|uniref:Uncharacterized protein n=1 Tax=Favolaschia claudopus TaxID=2862362 RepID=A0AAV9ZRN8_9AGAR